MVKSTKAKTKTQKKANVAGRASEASKVEELKLGKFADSVPMRLPESQTRRSWQVIGGVALLLIGGFCLISMVLQVPFAYLWQSEVDIWQAEMTPLTVSWIVNNVALVIFTILCLFASILLFAKKRVVVGMWYGLIVALVVGFISQSIGIYQNYTLVECGEGGCPIVVGELSMVLLCDLTILMLSILLLWMVYCMNRRKYRHEKKRRRK